MSTYVDGDTVFVNQDNPATVDNFLVKRRDDGSFDLVLAHNVEGSADHVDKAEIVATWHFESLEHLGQVFDKIVGPVQGPDQPPPTVPPNSL
jgi:hypothetical protein